jgi:hypothetical protein
MIGKTSPGDYACPYSRQAEGEIERVQRRLGDGGRFAFRPFPPTEIHPHVLAAAPAAEAAAPRNRFRETHELPFYRQHALADDDTPRHADRRSHAPWRLRRAHLVGGAGELSVSLHILDVTRSEGSV